MRAVILHNVRRCKRTVTGRAVRSPPERRPKSDDRGGANRRRQTSAHRGARRRRTGGGFFAASAVSMRPSFCPEGQCARGAAMFSGLQPCAHAPRFFLFFLRFCFIGSELGRYRQSADLSIKTQSSDAKPPPPGAPARRSLCDGILCNAAAQSPAASSPDCIGF